MKGHRPPVRQTTAARTSVAYDAQVRAADALRRRGRHDAAVKAFHALTMQYPQRSDAFNNLAAMLLAAGHSMPALQHVSRALELDPTNVAALLNSAEILKDFGEWQAALASCEAALTLQPTSPTLRFARALILLTLGRWHDAWQEHEARWEVPEMPLATLKLATPQWDGSDLAGRQILLDHEQGLGDQVMFARFATQVAARGGTVTMRCKAPLAGLFAAMPGVSAVITDADPIPTHAVHASLMSLPAMLGIRSPAQLRGAAYLAPVGECPAAIRDIIGSERLRVGLVWAGNPQHRNDARRSINPALLLPLVQLPGVRSISLQRHDDGIPLLPAVLQPHLRDTGALLHTCNDTAHALRQLDLLITVDTAVAHLAGALGVRTLLLLPFVPDWRWMLDRTDTPWYDSVTLLRQQSLFCWQPVIASACTRVLQLTAGAS